MIDAVEAQQDFEKRMGSVNLFNLPPILDSDRYQACHKIWTVSDYHKLWTVDTGMGTFSIPGAEPGFVWDFESGTLDEFKQRAGRGYDPLLVSICPEGMYTRRPTVKGEIAYSRPTFVPKMMQCAYPVDLRKAAFERTDGINVVADILGVDPKDFSKNGPYKVAASNLTHWGYFMSAGHVPTEAELKSALAKLTASLQEQWKAGQAEFLKGPQNMDNISPLHRYADTFLGRNAEWNKEAVQMKQCPGCGASMYASAAIHGGPTGCGWIVDAEAAEAQMKLKNRLAGTPKK